MASPQRRARRLPPADRRQQLLDCAIKVFADRGLARASHADVARQAGVAVPTVFSYFKSRDALLHGVLEAVAAYFEAMADRFHRPENPAPRAVLGHAVAFVTSVDSDPEYARLLLEWSTAIRNDIWPDFLRLQEKILRRFEATMQRGKVEGTIAPDLDVDSAALMIVGSIWIIIQMSFTRWPAEKIHRFMLAQLRGAIGPEAVARALA